MDNWVIKERDETDRWHDGQQQIILVFNQFYYLNGNTGKEEASQSGCLVISFPWVPGIIKLKMICMYGLVLDVICYS